MERSLQLDSPDHEDSARKRRRTASNSAVDRSRPALQEELAYLNTLPEGHEGLGPAAPMYIGMAVAEEFPAHGDSTTPGSNEHILQHREKGELHAANQLQYRSSG